MSHDFKRCGIFGKLRFVDKILPIDIRRLPSFTTRDYKPACISLRSPSLDQCVGGLVVK